MHKLKIEFYSENFTKPLKALRAHPVCNILFSNQSEEKKEKFFTPEEIMFITGATSWINIPAIQELGDNYIVFYIASSLEIENNENDIIFKKGSETFALIPAKEIKSITINQA